MAAEGSRLQHRSARSPLPQAQSVSGVLVAVGLAVVIARVPTLPVGPGKSGRLGFQRTSLHAVAFDLRIFYAFAVGRAQPYDAGPLGISA